MTALSATAILLAVVLCGGCTVGPRTIDRDRFDYVMAISESWKRQMLINLLKTRYLDAPVFMDVASVIQSYSLESEIELGAEWEPSGTTRSVIGTGLYADKPTISYRPLTGQEFTESLLTPIPIPAILLLLKSGVPADDLFRICTLSISGLNNRRTGLTMAQAADPEFYELLTFFRRAQQLNVLEFRRRTVDQVDRPIMIVRQPRNEGEADAISALLNRMDLDPALGEYPIVFGSFRTRSDELTIQSRSMMQVLIEYASYIDVPQSDVSEGRAYEVGSDDNERKLGIRRIIQIHSGQSRPDDAFVAVSYRSHWFWIDDRDSFSKGSFTFLKTLFGSTERRGVDQSVPLITIPTGG